MRSPVAAAERQDAALPARRSALAGCEEDNNLRTSGSRDPDAQRREERSDSEESDSDGEVSLRSVAATHRPATFAAAEGGAEAWRRDKRTWRAQSYYQEASARRRVLSAAKESQPQQQRDPAGNNALHDVAVRHFETRSSVSPERARTDRPQRTGDFAVEIESEAAEIRTLIARTAQLWSAVDQAERCEDLPPARHQPESGSRFPPPTNAAARTAGCTPGTAQYAFVGNEEGSTLSSDEYEYEGEDEDGDEDSEEDTGTESVGSDALRRIHREAGYAAADNLFIPSLRQVHAGSGGISSAQEPEYGGEVSDNDSDSNSDSEDQAAEAAGPSADAEDHGNGLHLEQGEVVEASNRAINASKARTIKDAMLGNLVQLGFRENLARAALEAGILEIDHYDSDCELAYVDIFMILVKMVCDAHLDALNGDERLEELWPVPTSDAGRDRWGGDGTGQNGTRSLAQRSFLPFKWPVFDMAQFEFGNARPGTCFNSVCVLTNLPKVSIDRTEELMEVLSCNLFCMIGDPIQVVIPSVSSTGRTKGHAFLEFDDPDMAKRCASAVEGLTWGRGPFGRIRGSLFRQYQVKTPAEEQRRDMDAAGTGRSFRRAYSGSQLEGNYSTHAGAFEIPNDEHTGRLEPNVGSQLVHQRSLLPDSNDERSSGEDEDEDADWGVGRPLEYTPLATSPLLDLSAGSVETREASEFDEPSTEMEMEMPSWDEEVLHHDYALRFCSGGNGDENDESFGSNGVLEMQTQDEEDKAAEQSVFEDLSRGRLNLHSSMSRLRSSSPMVAPFPSRSDQAEPLSDVTVTADGAGSRDISSACAADEQPWDFPGEDDSGAEKPWRSYCEDLIGRNRDMQEQVVFARRRIVQLSHNNQKLHLLIDRVERDRDGLLFENDLLQTQLLGYEDHEHDHDSMMTELTTLRKRLQTQESQAGVRRPDPRQVSASCGIEGPLKNVTESIDDIRSELSLQLSPATLESYKMKELKEWEHLLESALTRVRSVKEEKALEMQKKLDRQVEEQNELKLCVICLANEKTILCLPCRHLCLCKACSRRQEVTKCPICRLDIEEMLAVYS